MIQSHRAAGKLGRLRLKCIRTDTGQKHDKPDKDHGCTFCETGSGVISLLGNLFHSHATFDGGAVYAIVASRTDIVTMLSFIPAACKLGVHTVAVII